METDYLSIVYFPEVDRFLCLTRESEAQISLLLESDFYKDLEYFRYIPVSGASFEEIDLCLASHPRELCCAVTNDCNLSCPVCIADAPPMEPTYMSADRFTQILEELPSTIDRITVTGGEPTLNPELPDIIRHASTAAWAAVLSTNGLEPERVESAITGRSNVTVAVSLHGSEHVHDAFVDYPGSFKACMNTISTLVRRAIPIQIHSTITSDTLADLPALCNIVGGIPVCEHRLNLVKPFGRGGESTVSFDDVVRSVEQLFITHKVFVKRIDQPYLFINSIGKREVRHGRKY